MNLSTSEIRNAAYASIKGQWWQAIGLIVCLNVLTSQANKLGLLFSIPLTIFLIPLNWSVYVLFLRNYREKANLLRNTIYREAYKDFGRIVLTMLLCSLYAFAWILLFIVPFAIIFGILVGYLSSSGFNIPSWSGFLVVLGVLPAIPIIIRYILTAYILNDYPNLKNNAAIDLSKAMMKNNRMALVKAIWPYALICICGILYATYIITIIKVGGGFENILPQMLILFACIPFILWAYVCLYNTIAVFYEQAKLEYESSANSNLQ